MLLLTVFLTDAGPILRVQGGEVELASASLTLDCDRFALRARERTVIETTNLHYVVKGDVTQEVTGKSTLVAADVSVEARFGNVGIKANDDVDVKGERIRLNCDDAPMAMTYDDFRARHCDPDLPQRPT
jgi:hypothetical protein